MPKHGKTTATAARRTLSISTSWFANSLVNNGGNNNYMSTQRWMIASSSSSSAEEATSSINHDHQDNSSHHENEATAASSSSSFLPLQPTKGRIVKIACRLQPEGDFIPEPLIDGIVLHDDEPTVDLQFVLGWGNYLPGLHDLLVDMHVGETRYNVSLDAGWGEYNPQLVATVNFTDSGIAPDQVAVGTQLYLAPQNLPCTVTNVTETTFTIDANPPLAGASYLATVTLKDVQEGPVISKYNNKAASKDGNDKDATSRFEVATFALGCFCKCFRPVERASLDFFSLFQIVFFFLTLVFCAIISGGGELEFMRVPGVVGTAVGYTQGTVANPTYKQVCSGTTGHTEAILVIYDPEKASYETLVDVAMDRLGENKYLLNQVGNDKGTQYRHGIYYHTPAQKEVAEKVVASFGADCLTECKPADVFYFAEDYHQQYLLKGGQSARKGDTNIIRCYG